MNPGDTVQVDTDGETRYGVYLGERDGYAQVAFYTGNVPLEDVQPAPMLAGSYLWLDRAWRG